jgi:small subunit ribosomal protein S13
MVYKYKDKVLYLRGSLVNSLSGIYGIGTAKACFLIEAMGLSKNFKINNMNSYIFNCIVILIKTKYCLEERLREVELQRVEFFFTNFFIKGIRIFEGLPVRGQRTHSNHATPKRLKPFSEKLNAIIVDRQQKFLKFSKKKRGSKTKNKK